MKIGVSFDGFASFADSVEVAKEAEAAGAASLWMAEHLGYRDPLGCLTSAARAGRQGRPFKKSVDNNDLGYHAIALLPQLERRHPDFRHLVRLLRAVV